MQLQGQIRKMQSFEADPVRYSLHVGDQLTPIDSPCGREIALRFSGRIECLACGKMTNKSYQQGYCFRCFQTVPECEPCSLRPDACRAHLGQFRNEEWARNRCLVDHIVYLAQSSGIKVGVTRASQAHTRWIDQGASLAVPLAQMPNRFLAGSLESALMADFADRTDWRKMLRGVEANEELLLSERRRAVQLCPAEFERYLISEDGIAPLRLRYPMASSPAKPRAITFDKEQEFCGRLAGIRGQYLVLENGDVFNMRRHGGYVVELTLD